MSVDEAKKQLSFKNRLGAIILKEVRLIIIYLVRNLRQTCEFIVKYAFAMIPFFTMLQYFFNLVIFMAPVIVHKFYSINLQSSESYFSSC